MAVFNHPEFDNHEQVVFCSDESTGLKAIIAIHSTALGPATGGCRMWDYVADEDALVERIVGRFTCANCGEGYHDRYKLPKVADTCDVCGSHEFKRRPDDNEETVRTRMAEYRAKTAPILPIYEQRGIVGRVNGMAEIDHVTAAIERIMAG